VHDLVVLLVVVVLFLRYNIDAHYYHFGGFEMRRIDISDYEIKEVLLSWQKAGLPETATGYGSKLTTSKMIRYNGRWHRIYCMCYSNIGTCYIISKGEMILVD
jgi:hypothetical protein